MQIKALEIQHFKSIQKMCISDIEDALILVGKNNTGKTIVLDAIRAVCGCYELSKDDFDWNGTSIEIKVVLEVADEDLKYWYRTGLVSEEKNYDKWFAQFQKKYPGYQNHQLAFTFIASRKGKRRYDDGYSAHNPAIGKLLPHIFYIDPARNLAQFQEELLLLQEDPLLTKMRYGRCMLSVDKECNHCFSCIEGIQKKAAMELNALEAAKLLDYKLYELNLNDWTQKVNQNFKKNGGQEDIVYSMNRDVDKMLAVTTEIQGLPGAGRRSIERMGAGMRSVYMLSLLETYAEGKNFTPGIVLVEEPELFLHPRMQKVSGDILYRLSQKNQVIFETHSPNLLPNFNSRQIRQVVQDEQGYSVVRENSDISVILDDLGYSANDMMNVDFVFIVEGRQDKSRLPLLLEKYYSEIYDQEGRLSRTAIITTNSCTNIRTYANLKYMNQVYLKDNFLMIRDGDGKDAEELRRQLCSYYEEQGRRDVDHLPRVTRKNVLILKYYSFENYFFNPKIMAQIGVVKSEDSFYTVFLDKWKEYLHKLSSGKRLVEAIGQDLNTVDDIKKYMEEIRIHMRGHNLYDLFYGRFKKQEDELLRRYIELADREDFKDILDAIDQFIWFSSRRKEE